MFSRPLGLIFNLKPYLVVPTPLLQLLLSNCQKLDSSIPGEVAMSEIIKYLHYFLGIFNGSVRSMHLLGLADRPVKVKSAVVREVINMGGRASWRTAAPLNGGKSKAFIDWTKAFTAPI
ncbi:hypothetical protein GOBAR_DD21192 [Gossypium barbadense]|nr:hypothetical protein GOBAR_DD21192 [Gossypium barbadense]